MNPVRRVAVIGAGLSGTACAAALRTAGVHVDQFERGRAPGGRLAAPTVHGRRVDLGAAYFTISDSEFAAVAQNWADRGLARPWTDTMDAFSAAGRDTKSGPQRWAASDGLRALVRDLAPDGGSVELAHEVGALDELEHDVVVLAMPDPQAARLAPDAADWLDYEPVISVAAGWERRCWPIADAAFVNDDPDITLIADDGSRRGDGAPVLVIHSSAERARAHLDRPDDAAAPVLAAATRVLSLPDAPTWTHTHRWTFAKPVGMHEQDYRLVESGARLLGICGDAWCPAGSPRVESAWLSGHRLGVALAQRLA